MEKMKERKFYENKQKFFLEKRFFKKKDYKNLSFLLIFWDKENVFFLLIL